MHREFADTDFPPPASGNVVPLETSRRSAAPVPFPAQPYTRTLSPEAAVEVRLMRYRLEAERTARIVGDARTEGETIGYLDGWRAASPVYFALGCVVGLAIGIALGGGFAGMPL